jgi:hypothetical protein
MNARIRNFWIAAGAILILAALVLAFGAPRPVVAQGQGTPTLEPPSPRTPPPGPRDTPIPATPTMPPVTPAPTSALPENPVPESTTVATELPPSVLPVTGSQPQASNNIGLIIVLLGAGLLSLALGFNLQRRKGND